MNAAICVCHFCEAHGPRVVVCTRASEGASASGGNPPSCDGCSPGPAERARRLSSGRLTTASDDDALLAHAALRSLSCEVSSTAENSVVLFGDSRGYVLSYAFQIKDTQARGLKRWFSFIALMKDKLFLMSVSPFLSRQLEEIAKELQNLSATVFAKDQAVRSQRALRLINCKTENVAPRSLSELTGKQNVFAYMHIKFSWILNSCSKLFSERLCDGLSPISRSENSLETSTLMDNNKMSLYSLEKFLEKSDFLNILYCALIGLQIIIRGDSEKCKDIASCLNAILPISMTCLEFSDYVPSSEARLFYCKSNVALPRTCSGIFRVDIVDEKPVIHWSGCAPPKWPTLMLHILKGMENKFTEPILSRHIVALKEEWTNNTTAIKCVRDSGNSENIANIKTVMGIKAEDDDLIHYWISVL